MSILLIFFIDFNYRNKHVLILTVFGMILLPLTKYNNGDKITCFLKHHLVLLKGSNMTMTMYIFIVDFM